MAFSLFKLEDRFSKTKFSVGLDIGGSAVKFVKLRFSKDTVELCDFNIEPAAVDLIPALKHIAESQDTKKVNLAVSGSSTIIRYVSFPKMSETELKQALKFETQKHIPFSIEEVEVDSYILKQDFPDNKMLVLLAAVKKDFLSQRLKLLEEAGLKVGLTDLDSLALVNAFNYGSSAGDKVKNTIVALINIGFSSSNLNILENSIPRLSRDIHYAGRNFTEKIADSLNLDFKSAEALKLNPDKERMDKLAAAMESAAVNLSSEIRTSFDYYESQGSSSVSRIYLSGGGSLFTGLKDMLTNLLGIQVEMWDPLTQISLSGDIDSQKIKSVSGQLAVALGLALRG